MIGVLRDGDVVTVELQREQRRNALNMELLTRLRAAVLGAAADARVIVLTGRGSVFCAGADLAEVQDDDFTDQLLATLRTIDSVPVPVIAAVNGGALGAGTQLAMAADLRMLAPEAYAAIPVAKIGLAVDRWTVRRLVSLVGAGPARTMLFGAEQLGADEALRHGFANKIGSPADAHKWAKSIAELAPLTLRHLKLVLNDDGAHDEEPEPEQAAKLAAWHSRDAREGIAARQEKRTPHFTAS